ncbi:unnamed protein product, partial [Musa textilis]
VPIHHTSQRSCVVAQNNDAAAYDSLLQPSIDALSASLVQGRFWVDDVGVLRDWDGGSGRCARLLLPSCSGTPFIHQRQPTELLRNR